MFVLNSTEVRQNWSEVIDSVVREQPKFIKRTRDMMFISNTEILKEILKPYSFTANSFLEEDGSITLSLNEIDIISNGKNMDEAISFLVSDLKEYAEEYYKDFVYWTSAPNRKEQLPYVLRVLLLDNEENIKEIISFQDGKN